MIRNGDEYDNTISELYAAKETDNERANGAGYKISLIKYKYRNASK